MVIKNLDPNNVNQDIIKAAAQLILAGGIVAFPSDSGYGLAVNPHRPEAIDRLYKMKGRDPQKAISCVFENIDQIRQIVHISFLQARILRKNLPGPFTFVLLARREYPLKSETIGVRIPDHQLTQQLSQAVGQPFTATSANLSGYPACYSVDDLLGQFEGRIYQPDLILNVGSLPKNPSSTVIDLRSRRPITLREGSGKLK